PEDGDCAVAPTGETYEEIISGVRVERQGRPQWLYASTPELAIKAWRSAIDEYAHGKFGTIFWRIRPEIDGTKFRREVGAPVVLGYHCTRPLISDKPGVELRVA